MTTFDPHMSILSKKKCDRIVGLDYHTTIEIEHQLNLVLLFWIHDMIASIVVMFRDHTICFAGCHDVDVTPAISILAQI